MATMSRAEPKHMYSWWWASHMSPKNSKWLQENLTDMDSKVKLMIKLIEVDEDSFARRAEMYYKKRPELMKLVEEFYRAYRALAERYDHATGVIRHAHKTMAEAFPNQVPILESVDGSFGPSNGSDPRTPEMSDLVQAFWTPGELEKGDAGLTYSDFHSAERNGPFWSREASFAKIAEGRVRMALNFHDAKINVHTQKNEMYHEKAQGLSESDRLERSETDIKTLKEALAKFEDEKEAGLLQYQQSVQRLSNLESEVLHAQGDSKGFYERASKAEAELWSLKEALGKLEGEREASLCQYQQCLNRISSLESYVSRAQEDAEKRACKAEKEACVLKEELAQLKTEKEAGLAKYMEALENIANLENKLLLAEDKASLASERAVHAEKEVVTLKEALARMTEEKEAAALQYQQCLEKIASLENEIALFHEEAARLKDEMDQGTAKLKGAEEQCQLLERSNKTTKTELDFVLFKLGIQNEELSEKQDEVGRLWSCIQEERVRVVEAETAFRTLQDLHSQTQEELRSGAAELQKRVQLLKDMEVHNKNLQGEAQKIKDENKSLNELNTSSTVSMKKMDDEILNLKVGKEKLKEELELQLDQRSSLQKELYCLKEELNDLDEKHRVMLEQVESVGFEPECFVSSVTDLKEENSKLKQTCQSSEAEISALLEKLGAMEKLIEKNTVLEHSLSELSIELEDAREKVEALEESCQLLMNEKSIVLGEKATLISQLGITTENLERLAERNTFLEHSLFDANAELRALRAKSRNLEDSCKLLNDERQALELKLETAHLRLGELGGKHADLEKSYNIIEEERVSVLRQVEDLRNSLAAEKQEHDSSTQLSRIQMAEMESKICVLQVLVEQTRGQLGEELDKAANAQFEIFILRSTLQDLRETNCSLLKDCEKLIEASTLSEKLISALEHESTEQKEEVSFLIDQITSLRLGLFHLLKVLEVDLNYVSEDDLDADQVVLHHILVKLDDTRRSLSRAWDENQKLVIEKSVLVTLLGQLKQEVADLKTLIDSLQQEFRKKNDHLSSLQGDMLKLLQRNEKLHLRVREGNHKEELLASEMDSLRAKLQEMQGVCEDLEKENSRILEENRSLSKAVIDLDDKKHNIELENSSLVVETVTLDTLSMIFKNTILERSKVTNHLIDDIYKLFGDNRALEDKVRIMDAMLGEYQTENMSLKASLEMYDDELKQVKATQCQLEHEIANVKDQASHKEMELLQAEALNDEQGKEIHELSERYDQRIKESEFLRESMHNLEAEIRRMHVEHKETDIIVESLRSDLKKAKDEAELWETVAGTTFVELQTSSVHEALYREKLFELARNYQCLVDRNNSDGLKALQLKERVKSLEGENSQMKAQWIGYVPAMATLRDAVASLERHVMCTEADNVHDEDVSSSYRLTEGEQPEDEHHHSVIKQPNQTPDPQEAEGELAMKDIRLDQASESSSHRNNLNIWYNSAESDDQIVELWEAVDKVGNIQKPEAVNKHNENELHSSEIPAEKELRVDSLELSKRYTELNEAESNEKILERLSSDAQKLTNLQITVHDLKQKVVKITENSNPTTGKDADYSGVNDQLEEAERVIVKLLDANSKLVNLTEDCSTDTPLWPTSSPISDPSETGESERRRKVSKQARRCTEKIGRLQVEVQKIQFLLLKLDSGSIIGRSGGTRTVERDRKVPLRDYLYGAGACASRRRRTTRFCACLQPPTSGD